MKRLFLLITLIYFLQYYSYCQVETKFFPQGDAFNQENFIKSHPKAYIKFTMPPFDVQKYLDEDTVTENMKDIPFRFGKGFDVNITLSDGKWIDIQNGRLWVMEFKSDGAYSINFVFNDFFLSENSKLYITNTEGKMLYGPVTHKNNTKNGFFLTDMIQGDDVIIYLFEPTKELDQSKFIIKRVVHAYKNLFPTNYGNLNGSTLGCHKDIACYPAWDTQSDAVALVMLSDGYELCSGSLVITADFSFDPNFLSAFHCIDSDRSGVLNNDEISEAENWLFKFQYKMSTCNGSTATTSVTFNGANFRAAWQPTDFALMEMDDSPLGDERFTWLGWDRTVNMPSSGTIIHHPRGDVMKISFDYNNLTIYNSQIIWDNGASPTSPSRTHWSAQLDTGSFEPGSSGSPLFNQNKRLIGQLHGGQIQCPPATAFFGRLDSSWTGGGTNTSRLSNWLDPTSTGAFTTNTLRSPYISGSFLFCSSASFTLGNIPSVDSIIWTCGPFLTITSGQNTSQCTVTVTGNGSSYIQVRLVTDYGNITLPQKEVWVGAPPLYDFSGPVTIPLNSTAHYLVSDGFSGFSKYGITSYDWSITSRLQFESSHYNQIDVYIKGITLGRGTVSFFTTNSCGTSTFNFPVRVVSSGLLSIYPNPVSNEITIEINGDTKGNDTLNVSSVSEQSTDVECQVTIYNSSGVPVYIKMFSNNEIKVNTSGWQKGIYYVILKTGNEKYTGSFIIE